MRRGLVLAALVTAACGASAVRAAAHPGHASCRAAGQFAAGLARALGAEFAAQASALVQQGLADDFMAATHAAVRVIASLAATGELLYTRLRGCNASRRGAASFVAETIARVRGRRRSWRVDPACRLGLVLHRCSPLGLPAGGGVLGHRPQELRHPAGDRGDPDDMWTPIPCGIAGGDLRHSSG